MSQLLGKIAKLSSSLSSVRKKGICSSKSRFFSTVAAATPYLLFSEFEHVKMLPNLYLDDPRKEERVKIPVQTLPDEFYPLTWTGSSKGWVGIQNQEDFTISLTNIFNPCASVSSHKFIALPPLYGNKVPTRISLSSSPNQQDCVVAAFSPLSYLNLCRPGDSDWTRIKVPPFGTEVMYSVRDQKFYLRGDYREANLMDEYKGPMDLECFDFPQVSLHQICPLSDNGIPKSKEDQLIPAFPKSYLVESPSGDLFIVYWYEELVNVLHNEHMYHREPPRGFVVFRQDQEQRICAYTEDIGDLCIFLSKSEAFCVSATEYPGLKPNSIYFACFDSGSGFYDLSSNTLHHVIKPPYHNYSYQWLAPLQ